MSDRVLWNPWGRDGFDDPSERSYHVYAARRPLTLEERAYLKVQLAGGASLAEIATDLGCFGRDLDRFLWDA